MHLHIFRQKRTGIYKSHKPEDTEYPEDAHKPEVKERYECGYYRNEVYYAVDFKNVFYLFFGNPEPQDVLQYKDRDCDDLDSPEKTGIRVVEITLCDEDEYCKKIETYYE